ncbi:hypothetical protein Gpo141_00006111 [Globisporangium polare]
MWLPRDFVTFSDGTRLGTGMSDERWLQMDDPELLALMTLKIDSSARCMSMDTYAGGVIADVRREFLVPDLSCCDVSPAQVNLAAVEALHAKIARFSTESAIMSRGRQQLLCISFILRIEASLAEIVGLVYEMLR